MKRSVRQQQSSMPSISTYKSVLECWGVSALAGNPDAPRRALSLVDRMEAQCLLPTTTTTTHEITTFNNNNNNGRVDDNNYNRRSSFNNNNNYYNDDSIRPTVYIYNTLIQVCQNANHSNGMDTIHIAFEAYNRMIQRNIQPLSMTYVSLLRCCRSSQKLIEQEQFAKKAFDDACEYGLVNNFVLDSLRSTCMPLYKSYSPKPEHSANVVVKGKKMKS